MDVGGGGGGGEADYIPIATLLPQELQSCIKMGNDAHLSVRGHAKSHSRVFTGAYSRSSLCAKHEVTRSFTTDMTVSLARPVIPQSSRDIKLRSQRYANLSKNEFSSSTLPEQSA